MAFFYTGSVINHGDHNFVILCRRGNRHRALRVTVLNGIVQKVDHSLLKKGRVDLRRQRLLTGKIKTDVFGRRLDLTDLNGGL